jgi:hypothetical protein
MSILVNKDSRVCVQGITGREGMTRTRLMTEYGTSVVAGVTPGKGGEEVVDVPVYDTMFEAMEATADDGGIDISVLFIPAPLVKSAAIEAIEAGVKLLVIVPDRVPIWDVMEIADAAIEKDAAFLGGMSVCRSGSAWDDGRYSPQREGFFQGGECGSDKPLGRDHIVDRILSLESGCWIVDNLPCRRRRGYRPSASGDSEAIPGR